MTQNVGDGCPQRVGLALVQVVFDVACGSYFMTRVLIHAARVTTKRKQSILK